MHKMKANAVCHSVPMPKVYAALSPSCEELDEVLAFLYIGPSKPTPKEYACIPFLVHHNKVAQALSVKIVNRKVYIIILSCSHRCFHGYSHMALVGWRMFEAWSPYQRPSVSSNC
ncbi:hypothetical protein BKA93DRAFT_745271 [Sparassis latifolia]